MRPITIARLTILAVALVDLGVKLFFILTHSLEIPWSRDGFSLVFLYHLSDIPRALIELSVLLVLALVIHLLRLPGRNVWFDAGLFCLLVGSLSRILDCLAWQCAGIDWIGVRVAGSPAALNLNDILLTTGEIQVMLWLLPTGFMRLRDAYLRQEWQDTECQTGINPWTGVKSKVEAVPN